MAPQKHRRIKRKDAQHVRLYRHMMDSDAYLSLTSQARAVLMEVARIYNGGNNGLLAVSVRTAATRCNISKDTASRAFIDLERKGFIELVKRGAFSLKHRHASEWRLTWVRCDVTDALPSRAFHPPMPSFGTHIIYHTYLN